MGYVVVVSLPVVLFILIVAIAFYLLGRERGRSEMRRQQYGPPVPAPPIQAEPPPPPPPPDQEKPSASQV